MSSSNKNANAKCLQETMLAVKRRCDDISRGETLTDISESLGVSSKISRFTTFLKEYIQHVRSGQVQNDFTAPEVHYIWGPPAAGKTKYVVDKEPKLYTVPNAHAQWRDNYEMEEAVLFDNMKSDLMKDKDKSAFLGQIDRYPIQVPVRRGFVWWKPLRIYILSLDSPDEFAKKFENPDQFLRRVTKVIHLPVGVSSAT
jgi:hypothetical protein